MDPIVLTGLALAALLLAVFLLGRDQKISIGDGSARARGSETVESLIRSGQKIGAIKLLREESGLGLKEAKHEVERLERELSPL